MKSQCPCCRQELEFSLSTENPIGNLIECSHCQSVLKWDSQALQVVRKGITESSPKFATEEHSSQESCSAIEELGVSNESQEENLSNTPAQSPQEETDSVQSSPASPKEEIPIENTEEVAEPAASIAKEQNLSDVEAYGNKESSAYTSLLRYDLQISGVDSVSVEKQIESILKDSRLKIDVKACMEQKKNNTLCLKSLNPVKAVYLVSQLIHLPLELSWKQYMAVKTEAEEHEEGKMDIN